MSRTETFKTRAGDIVLDARKVAFLPESRTLLVADMHFEKGSYLREFGRSALPAFDTYDTIERLWVAAQAYRPARIIALGDSFHDIEADKRLSPKSAARLNQLKREICDIIWVLGNHDPDIPAAINGAREDHVQIGGFLLTHHPHDTPAHDRSAHGNGSDDKLQKGFNICGHYHPKAKISSRAGSVTAPCFAMSDSRLIMPSFGTYTGGLFVSDLAFKEAMPDMDWAAMVYEDRVFKIAKARLKSGG